MQNIIDNNNHEKNVDLNKNSISLGLITLLSVLLCDLVILKVLLWYDIRRSKRMVNAGPMSANISDCVIKIFTLVVKRRICHFTKWQIRRFTAKMPTYIKCVLSDHRGYGKREDRRRPSGKWGCTPSQSGWNFDVGCAVDRHGAGQSQMAVSARFKNEQIPPFDFARRHGAAQTKWPRWHDVSTRWFSLRGFHGV